MNIWDYLNTVGGMIWTAACIPLGIFLSWLLVWVINRIPAKWLCDYGEEPSEELLSGKRVCFKKEGIITAVIFCISLVMCRLQFNKGFDIYFIVLSLIVFFAVMTAVCDIKYMIIPDQFTIAIGILSAAVSVYDNGKGMTREEINKYLNIPSFTLIFGIYHLNQHLKDEFDTELWIDSRTNKYTRVYFQVPLVETKNRKEAAVR